MAKMPVHRWQRQFRAVAIVVDFVAIVVNFVAGRAVGIVIDVIVRRAIAIGQGRRPLRRHRRRIIGYGQRLAWWLVMMWLLMP